MFSHNSRGPLAPGYQHPTPTTAIPSPVVSCAAAMTSPRLAPLAGGNPDRTANGPLREQVRGMCWLVTGFWTLIAEPNRLDAFEARPTSYHLDTTGCKNSSGHAPPPA